MRTLFILLLCFCSFPALAAREPDSLAVSKLYSTSWVLTERYTIGQGIFHRTKKIQEPTTERMTIYNNEIHFNVDSTYQVCRMRHRNKNEFWLDCLANDQLIYKVTEIKGDELTIDVFTKQRDGKYLRTGKRYYKRAKN